jgi:hypothetical protein
MNGQDGRITVCVFHPVKWPSVRESVERSPLGCPGSRSEIVPRQRIEWVLRITYLETLLYSTSEAADGTALVFRRDRTRLPHI